MIYRDVETLQRSESGKSSQAIRANAPVLISVNSPDLPKKVDANEVGKPIWATSLVGHHVSIGSHRAN